MILFRSSGVFSMFLYLTFAHLIADFPLQPNWMVRAKRKPKGLLLHTGVHFVVMLILFGSAVQRVWWLLVVVAAFHYGIDTFKNYLSGKRPEWIIAPYVFDQILHFLSLWLVATWMEKLIPPENSPVAGPWLIYGIAFLFVTYVWFISERILFYANEAYQRELAALAWQRMIARLILLIGLVRLGSLLPGVVRRQADHLGPGLALSLPYLTGKYRRRAFMVDLGVALIAAIFIQVAI